MNANRSKNRNSTEVVQFLYMHLKALVFLYAFEESVDCHLLSSASWTAIQQTLWK